jgi:hypothetical protein
LDFPRARRPGTSARGKRSASGLPSDAPLRPLVSPSASWPSLARHSPSRPRAREAVARSTWGGQLAYGRPIQVGPRAVRRATRAVNSGVQRAAGRSTRGWAVNLGGQFGRLRRGGAVNARLGGQPGRSTRLVNARRGGQRAVGRSIWPINSSKRASADQLGRSTWPTNWADQLVNARARSTRPINLADQLGRSIRPINSAHQLGRSTRPINSAH